MGVSPIRDEFVLAGGETQVRTVKFFNNADVPYTLYLTAEDCNPSTSYGTPLCTPYTGTGVDIERASSWIRNFSETGNFVVPPKSDKTITYTISAPPGATPGGHYGGIFFNNPDNGVSGGSNTVKMLKRIGMLFLITAPGQITVKPGFWAIMLESPQWEMNHDRIPETFFAAPVEYTQGTMKRFMMNFSDTSKRKKLLTEINPFWSAPTLSGSNFALKLKVPVRNDGNTHIKPRGKIFLYDTDGTQLARVGKESIQDENGVYLGEKIVDYLPINDEWGNVLPDTERIFDVNWLGFAYEGKDSDGKAMIKFETPSDYYSSLTESESQYIYPWERMTIQNVEKTIAGKVEIAYKNPLTGKDDLYTVDIPVNVNYPYITKTYNWSLICIVLFLIWCVYLIFFRRRRQYREDMSHLEDEIVALEAARRSMTKKVEIPKTRKS
jgi:hypothetical protein